MAAKLSREEVRAIEWDCAQVLTRFFNAFDQWLYEDMGAMFAPDGVWHRQGKALRGGAEVVAALAPRSRTQTIRHVVTNTQIDVRDGETAEFLLYITAYMHDTGSKPARPPTIRSPYLLLVVPGTMTRVGESWKIASMSMNREFEFPPAG